MKATLAQPASTRRTEQAAIPQNKGPARTPTGWLKELWARWLSNSPRGAAFGHWVSKIIALPQLKRLAGPEIPWTPLGKPLSDSTLTYQWDLDDDGIFGESGSAAMRGDELGPQPIFRAVGLSAPTNYPISFRITDSGGLTNTVSTNVRVDENLPPVGDAGGPYDVREDRNVTLDGGGSSDPERPADTLIYEWDLDLDGIFGRQVRRRPMAAKLAYDLSFRQLDW